MSSILKRLEQLEKLAPEKRAIKAFLYAGEAKTDEEAIAEYKLAHPDKAADVFVVYRRGEDEFSFSAYDKDMREAPLMPQANMPKLSDEDMVKAKEWLEDKIYNG